MPLGLPRLLRGVIPVPKIPDFGIPGVIGSIVGDVAEAVGGVAGAVGDAASVLGKTAIASSPYGIARSQGFDVLELAGRSLGTEQLAKDFGEMTGPTVGRVLSSYTTATGLGTGLDLLGVKPNYDQLGKDVGESFIPTKVWEVPLTVLPAASRAKAGIKAGEPLLKTAISSVLEGLAIGPSVARKNALLDPSVARYGSGPFTPPPDELPDDVARMAFGDAVDQDLERLTQHIDKQMRASQGTSFGDFHIAPGPEGKIYVDSIKDPSLNRTFKTPMEAAAYIDSQVPDWADDLWVPDRVPSRVEAELEARREAMRRALSDEDLGSSSRSAQGETWEEVVTNLSKVTDDITELYRNQDAFTPSDFKREYDKLYTEERRLDKELNRLATFTDPSRDALDSSLARMSEDGLQRNVEITNKVMSDIQAVVDEKRWHAIGMTPDQAVERLQELKADANKYQAWLDFRQGKHTFLSEPLWQAIDRQMLGDVAKATTREDIREDILKQQTVVYNKIIKLAEGENVTSGESVITRTATGWRLTDTLDKAYSKEFKRAADVIVELRKADDLGGPGTPAFGFTADTRNVTNINIPKATRSIEELTREVVTVEDYDNLITKLVKRGLAGLGINPELARSTPAGKVVTAYARKTIEDEGEIDSYTAHVWGAYSSGGKLHRPVFDVSWSDGTIKVATKANPSVKDKIIWHAPFEARAREIRTGIESPYLLSDAQNALIDRFNYGIRALVRMGEEAGLPVRTYDRIEDYVPHQIKSVLDVPMKRPSSPALRRIWEDSMEAWTHGRRYQDPETTLKIFATLKYQEIANMQLTDAISRFQIKPNELIPEHIRIARDQANKASREASKWAKLEARQTKTLYARFMTKDVNAAQAGYTRARQELTRIEGELAGRAQLAAGRRQTPVSFGRRLAEARAHVNAAKGVLDYAKGLQGRALRVNPTRLQSVKTATELKAAKAASDKVDNDYAVALKSAETHYNIGSPAFFSTEAVAARRALELADQAHNKAKDAAKAAHRSFYQDPDYVSTLKDRRAANTEYDKTIRDAKNKYLGSQPESLEQWHEKFMPIEQVKQIEEGLDHLSTYRPGSWVGKTVGRFGEDVANVLRIGATTFDFAAPFIHGIPVLVENPLIWANGTFRQFQAFFAPGMFARFLDEYYDDISEMSLYELVPGNLEWFTAIERGKLHTVQGLADLLEKLPAGAYVRHAGRAVGRETIGRFAAAYNMPVLYWRTMLWRSMKGGIGQQIKLGPKNIDWGWKTPADLAAHIRNVTGGLDTRALGTGARQRAFEGMWIGLSPRLMRSTIALGVDVMRVARRGPQDARGRAALSRLAMMASGISFGYFWIGGLLGKSEEEIREGLNPLNGKKFLSHEINGQWIGLGGQMRAILQLLAGVYSAAAPAEAIPFGLEDKPLSDILTTNGQANPLLKYIIDRGAPMLQATAMTAEGITRANLSGYEQVDGAMDVLSTYGTNVLPFTVQGIIEGDSILGSVTGVFGARSSPVTPSEEREDFVEANIIPSIEAKGYFKRGGVVSRDQLGSGEADEVDRQTKAALPSVQAAYEQRRREFGSIFQKKDDERKATEATFKPALDQLHSDLITGAQDPRKIHADLRNVRSELRGGLSKLYADPEYQKAIAKLEPNEMRKLEDEYFKIVETIAQKHGAKPGDKFLLSDEQWDEVEAAQQRFITDLRARSPGLQFDFLQNLDWRDSVVDAHPIIKLKREIDAYSKAYYDIKDETLRKRHIEVNPDLDAKRWTFYGGVLNSIEAVDIILTKDITGAPGSMLKHPSFNRPIHLEGFARPVNKDLESWSFDKNKISYYLRASDKIKGDMLKAGAFNAMMIYWGHIETLHTKNALPVLDNYMRETKWSLWELVQPAIGYYLGLPNQSIKQLDKPRALATLPKLDAYVAAWKEFLYGKTPVFKSEAGRAAFHALTGRDASQFAIVPLE